MKDDGGFNAATDTYESLVYQRVVSFCTARKPTGTYDRFMLNVPREQCAGGWRVVILTLSAGIVAAGVAASFGHVVLMPLACLAPSAVMLLVWHGPPPQTVDEPRYDPNAPSTDDRR